MMLWTKSQTGTETAGSGDCAHAFNHGFRTLHFVFFITPRDDINTILLTNKCREKEMERTKYSKLIICPFIKYKDKSKVA